jgi:hypothetical protein
MMEKNAWTMPLWEELFCQDGAPPHFYHLVRAFLDRDFLIVGQEEEDPFPDPLLL